MSVELSRNTIEILSNFATINSNILLRPNNILSTFTSTKHIFAYAVIEETFDREFGIYDLGSFLNVISSFENPVLDFSEQLNPDETSKFVMISEKNGSSSFKYMGTVKNHIDYLDKDLKMPEPVIEFDLSDTMLKKCRRVANIASLPNIVLESVDGDSIELVVRDQERENNNEFRMNLKDKAAGDVFEIVFDANNLKLMDGTYHVAMDGKVINKFSNDDKKLTYYIANESVSTYG